MKRTLLALFLSPLLAGAAYAGKDDVPPPPGHPAQPPQAPHAPLPPLPPLPPMANGPTGSAVATLDVKGPVTVRADVLSAEIEVVAGSGKQVKAQLIDSSGAVRLSQQGDRVEVGLNSKTGWPHVPAGIDGKLRLEVPAGSSVELTSASGDIQVRDTGGAVRLRTASGEVRLRKVSNVEVMAVSGDVVVENATGEVRLRTVSGDAKVSQWGGGAKLEYGTTSGDLDWTGACGAGCRIEARSTSGDVRLNMSPSSSFDLRFVTHSGDVGDDLKMQTLEQNETRHGGGSLHARYGRGEGLIEAQTFSGDLRITKK
jgi:putative adhesin